MSPTLNNNGIIEFGIIDKHSYTIDHLNRFDIVTTFYPTSYGTDKYDYCYIDDLNNEIGTDFNDKAHEVVLSKNATTKIKRVIALPGEQFLMEENAVKIRCKNSKGEWEEWESIAYPFKHALGDKINESPITLNENEYWVIGDNWNNSIDCASLNHCVYRENINGVLIAIQGTCEISIDNNKSNVFNKKYYTTFKYFKR